MIFVLGAGAGFLVAHLAIQTLTWVLRDRAESDRSSTCGTTGGLRRSARASRWSAGAPHGTLAGGAGAAGGAAAGDEGVATVDWQASGRLGTATRVLVAGQVALSLVLLVGAVMFVKTMVNLRAVDLGFNGIQRVDDVRDARAEARAYVRAASPQ